ncbi:uncharacterized protein LOC132733898 [Ruditapes philippinarum]|uniref:uncharacterized protein LOC132733898 n=1 Tax=Ruditapes philippinarum TaxID=129788 RepID=UPI00295A7077|nr:uncharacterized protein LOC132733898 [Ruditapes philippinarum]
MFAGWTVTWIITIGVAKAYQFPIPDFESPWLYLQAQAGTSKAMETVMHGLNEVPIFVDVQVKSLDSPNKGYIFQAIGALPRDDDAAEPFGGVTYIYDSTQIIVCAPQHANGGNTSYAIYTENGAFYAGVNNQSSYNVEVRIRAWKKSSLPPADFERTGIHMTAGNTSNGKLPFYPECLS